MTNESPRLTIKFLPPLLEETLHIDTQLLCARPMRLGRPNISIETRNKQLLIHNYGHGGSGWTLLWGSVERAVTLFLKQLKLSPHNRERPITIIGAGAMGLACAYKLNQLRAKHPEIGPIKIIAKETRDLPSYRAAGLWAEVSMHNDFEGNIFVRKLAIRSFKEYLKIAQHKNKDFTSESIELQPYLIKPGTEPGVNSLVNAAIIPPPLLIEADFGGAKHPALFYQSIYINTHVIMQTLQDYVKTAAIPMECREINCFSECGENAIVFNCSGLGARELNQDKNMVAINGHLATLKNQPRAFLETTQKNPLAGATIDLEKIKHYATLLLSKPASKRFLAQIEYLLTPENTTWFKTNKEKIDYIRGFAKLIFLVKKNFPQAEKNLMDFYAKSIPQTYSRYMFTIKKISDQASDERWIYFMVTSEKLPSQWLTEHPRASEFSVGKIGGTFLTDESLKMTDNAREFKDMLMRIRIYCYGHD